jgi:hypothetical protein
VLPDFVFPYPGKSFPGTKEIEAFMFAYLLLLIAVLSRLLPHAGWFNFTAVGGALLYFGARRSKREMLVPLAALMATDYYLTVYSYHYSFGWQSYVPTWAWYLAEPDHRGSRGSGRSAGADLVFRALKLCGLGRLWNVSPHAGRVERLFCGRNSLLSQ